MMVFTRVQQDGSSDATQGQHPKRPSKRTFAQLTRLRCRTPRSTSCPFRDCCGSGAGVTYLWTSRHCALQRTGFQPPVVWPHTGVKMGKQQFGGLPAEDMQSRRQPQPPDAVVALQEMLVLSFTLPHTLCTLLRKYSWYRASMDSSTLGRGAVPSCISKCGRKESAIRVPFLHGTRHLPTSRHGPPPPLLCFETCHRALSSTSHVASARQPRDRGTRRDPTCRGRP